MAASAAVGRLPAGLARILACLCLLTLLAGCQKVELYSDLSERDGNEILALLLSQGIAADKSRDKESVAISIPRDQVARSLNILNRAGLPRDRFTDLGQIFQKQGLISSPMEERVRYTYGISQMLADAISQIDGVLTARVLIVLPEAAAFGETAPPPSASVFIKHLDGSEIQEAVPRIKAMVQNSVDGLSYDKIAVVLFGTSQSLPEPSAFDAHANPMPEPSQGWVAIGALASLLVLALSAAGYLGWRLRRASRPPGPGGSNG
ncbi:type III secretion system inner membrane ring lipoprotein SctJ [Imhoffiella purpurea]|uniref:Lipoprotein n=1 Tax=Imhoffiella purpurea TaxID=1249627 RepID=W9VHZ0_9GAMM|nr:type III secretion inner membrane ring lipoprotein SctJ [Imhoffiella purpurea]EXJ15667.1 Type III secretion bridge between inner and outermembrane lipoprotein (YscJ,HrcJ,EscJ, PscJ) [Imhoffiella purpurea]